MTFAKGAALKDPSSLFNSSLDGNTRRAIDLHEGEKIDEEALMTLVRAAVTLNKSTAQAKCTESNIFRGILQGVAVLVPLSSQRLKSIDSLDELPGCEVSVGARRTLGQGTGQWDFCLSRR
jgi:hypothetical protein